MNYCIQFSCTFNNKESLIRWYVNLYDLPIVLRYIRQILITIIGQNANLYKNFCKFNQNHIPPLPYNSGKFTTPQRTYILSLNYLDKKALIEVQENKVSLSKIGTTHYNEDTYDRVVDLMVFLIKIIEGSKSNKAILLNHIAKGNYNIPSIEMTKDLDFLQTYSWFYRVLAKTYTIVLEQPKDTYFEIFIAQD